MSFRIGDPVLGEDIAAMVVPGDPRISEGDQRRYLLDHLVQFKVPRRIWFVDDIPKNSFGKPCATSGPGGTGGTRSRGTTPGNVQSPQWVLQGFFGP